MLGRRAFLIRLGAWPGALVAALALLQQGCGGSSDSSGSGYGTTDSGTPDTGTSPSTCDGKTPASESGSHFHPVCLTLAELNAGQAVTLTLEAGSAGHTHTLALTQQQVTDLKAGASVSATSSVTSGHSHDVTS
jgi:hypothetical protein